MRHLIREVPFFISLPSSVFVRSFRIDRILLLACLVLSFLPLSPSLVAKKVSSSIVGLSACSVRLDDILVG